MTARKTTPHLKRGPKRKRPQQEPTRGKGAPTKSLRQNADRYELARLDVAKVWLKGREFKGDRMGAMLASSMTVYRQRGDVADLREVAERLRSISKRYRRPADMKWRGCITSAASQAILAAASGLPLEPERLALIMKYAAEVGEEDWVEREVLPLTGLKPLGSHNLTESDLLAVVPYMIAMIGWASDIREWIAARAARIAAESSPKKVGFRK